MKNNASTMAVPSLVGNDVLTPTAPAGTPTLAHSGDTQGLYESSKSNVVQPQPPNALQSLQQLIKNFEGRKPVIMLDYDGTLTPIVKDPNQALMSKEVRETVARVSSKYPTGIVSGRALSKLQTLVQLDNLHYIGSHGFDTQSPSTSPFKTVNTTKAHTSPNFQNFLPTLQNFRDSVILALQATNHKIWESAQPREDGDKGPLFNCSTLGAFVEDNKFSISVHYRNVPTNFVEEVQTIVDTVLLKFGARSNDTVPLTKRHGKKVWEIRPAIKWNKGTAVASLLSSMSYAPDGGENANEIANGKSIATDDGLESKSDDKHDGQESSRACLIPGKNPVERVEGTTPTSIFFKCEDSIFNQSKGDPGPQELCTIFIGDDMTDEDVFDILSVKGERPHYGIGICVLDTPRPTKAMYSLRNVKEVHEFLANLANL
jgi:trehalose 6-phosphate phosphatase